MSDFTYAFFSGSCSVASRTEQYVLPMNLKHSDDFYVCVHAYVHVYSANVHGIQVDCYFFPGLDLMIKQHLRAKRVNQKEPTQPLTMTGKMDEKEGMTCNQRSQDDLST